jgi:hypothetical protein
MKCARKGGDNNGGGLPIIVWKQAPLSYSSFKRLLQSPILHERKASARGSFCFPLDLNPRNRYYGYMKIFVKTLPFILTVLVFVSCNACSGNAQTKKDGAAQIEEPAQTAEDDSDDGYSGGLGGFGMMGGGGFSSMSSGDSRNDIDAFFSSYEMLIARAENAKAKDDFIALFSLETQHIDLTARSEKLKQSSEWTKTDEDRLSALNAKAANALSSQ